jgi:hypothetical protein
MAAEEMRVLRRALEMVTEGGDAPGVSGFQLAAIEVRESARPWTLAKNTQGLGIAERITAGRKLDELALKVYVEKKLPKSQCDYVVPKRIKVPGSGAAYRSRLMSRRLVGLSLRRRLAAFGQRCGLGRLEVQVGTFGCLARKWSQPDNLYVLSNSHVLANQGICKVGDVVIQAGRYDSGVEPGDVICELAEWILFDFDPEGYPNLVDAAIAQVRKPGEITAAVRLIGIPTGYSLYVRRGMNVYKSGRTTDYTVGEIRDIDYRLQI